MPTPVPNGSTLPTYPKEKKPRFAELFFNPDSAVGREVMSEEQTFRNEDNAFLPLRSRPLSVRCVTTLSTGGGEPTVKKDFETEHSGVFAAPGLPLAHFSTAEFGFNPSHFVFLGLAPGLPGTYLEHTCIQKRKYDLFQGRVRAVEPCDRSSGC
jgi:hypothetical protein